MPRPEAVYPGLKAYGLFDEAIPATQPIEEISRECQELCKQDSYEWAVNAAEGAVIQYGPAAFELYFDVKLQHLSYLFSLGEILDRDLVIVSALLLFAKIVVEKGEQNDTPTLQFIAKMADEFKALKRTQQTQLEDDLVASTLKIIQQKTGLEEFSRHCNGAIGV